MSLKQSLILLSFSLFMALSSHAGAQETATVHPRVDQLIASLQQPVERFKSLVYAVANQDLGSADELFSLNHSEAAILGFRVKGGVGLRKTVDKVYPLLQISAHVVLGIGATIVGSQELDRRESRPAFGIARDNPASAGVIVVEEEVQTVQGEGAEFDRRRQADFDQMQAAKQAIADAERDGRVEPKWNLWRAARRSQQIDALGLTLPQPDPQAERQRYGVASEGQAKGIGLGLMAPFFGIEMNLAVPVAKGSNDEVRESLQRALANLSTIADLGRSQNILKAEGIQTAELAAAEFSRSVESLDVAIKRASSYVGYSSILSGLVISGDSVFRSSDTLLSQTADIAPLSHHSPRELACSALLRL